MKLRFQTGRLAVGHQKSGSKAFVFGLVAAAASVVGIAIIVSSSGGGVQKPEGKNNAAIDKRIKGLKITNADSRQIQDAKVKLSSVYKSMSEVETRIAPDLSAAEISTLDTQISRLVSDMDSADEVLGRMSDKYNQTFISRQ